MRISMEQSVGSITNTAPGEIEGEDLLTTCPCFSTVPDLKILKISTIAAKMLQSDAVTWNLSLRKVPWWQWRK